jgi:hypothetical protein
MEHNEFTYAAVDASGNGAASTPPLSTTPCPLNDLPSELHQYIHTLPAQMQVYFQQQEARIKHLESEQKRFTNALLGAGKFIFDNPASKMMLAAFPKEAQNKLREFFAGSNGNNGT